MKLKKIIKNNEIKNFDFSNKELKDLDFSNLKLTNVLFENSKLEKCNFDNTILNSCSFKNAELRKCRFRKAKFAWTDLRYAEIESTTFEDSKINYCDFYRTVFSKTIIFRKSRIANTSFYYTQFNDGVTIKKDNLVNSKIIQENKEKYKIFLTQWIKNGPGLRKNDQDTISDWNIKKSLNARWPDAEDIYKNLNGLWTSNGNLSDANWAFVKGKKMERKRLIKEIKNKETDFSTKIKKSLTAGWNFTKDVLFGYGESIKKMMLTYVITVFLFAYIYYASQSISITDYALALKISLKNMVAISSEETLKASPFLDFLNMVQTTIGILITGIFGFILGNKIRNQ